MGSWRPTLLRRDESTASLWEKDNQGQLKAIELELSGIPKKRTRETEPPSGRLTAKRLSSRYDPVIPYTINIAAISPSPFYITIKRKGNVHFVTSIYNIDRELESRNELGTLDKGLELRL